MGKSHKTKKLPKNFDQLLKRGNLKKLQAVFDECDVDARGGYDESTALMMPACPDELARWLVAQGADVKATSKFDKTALHERAFFPQYSLKVLIEVGCDIHAKCSQGTALHIAAERGNLDGMRLLLKAGAKVELKNAFGNTPLEHALQSCRNCDIEGVLPAAQLLLKAGAKKSARMKQQVERIGQQFEWFRDVYSPQHLPTTEAALQKLYKLFAATPAPPKVKHDGRSPIVAKSKTWPKAHQELWELLVPARGAASTVQGEVIRISGRISSELYRNGGGNWDRDFRRMANSFLKLIASGKSLDEEQIRSCKQLTKELPANDDADLLVEMSVTWVKLNPKPVPLGKVAYKL